jgi:Na+-translocating ferredoxin:NAD+ oxidoreductase RnfG subunit
MDFIGKNFKMPDYEGYGGTIKVAFIIEIDGSVTNVKVVKDLGDGTGDEAKRVVSISPRWTSGEFRGKKVRVLYELPIKIASQG